MHEDSQVNNSQFPSITNVMTTSFQIANLSKEVLFCIQFTNLDHTVADAITLCCQENYCK